MCIIEVLTKSKQHECFFFQTIEKSYTRPPLVTIQILVCIFFLKLMFRRKIPVYFTLKKSFHIKVLCALNLEEFQKFSAKVFICLIFL